MNIRWKKRKKFIILYMLLICFMPASICKAEELFENEVQLEAEETKVEEQEETVIKASELDLGDYQSEMAVGEKQLLYVTVLPVNVENQTLSYTSSDIHVATINGMGRITALAEGETTITVFCQDVKAEFLLKVKKPEAEEETIIKAVDIELSGQKNELYVEETMSIQATVLPNTATDSSITYQSTNANIATVSSSGEVKGIAAGEVKILVHSGDITKEIPLKVKIKTTAIQFNTNYKVVEMGEVFRLEAAVVPNNADSHLSYKSMDEAVAIVTGTGEVTAKGCGSTSIIVSNSDLQAAVTVIVNEKTADDTKKEEVVQAGAEIVNYPNEIKAEECSIITSEMLKYYYENSENLMIQGDNYKIYIDGKDIVNYQNEFYSQVNFDITENGIQFVLNQGKNLCGKIKIDVSRIISKEQYLYLYNSDKKQYENIKVSNRNELQLDTEGMYLLTEKKILKWDVNLILVLSGCVAIVAGIVVYIIIKKKYWFW